MAYKYPNLAAEIARKQLDYSEIYKTVASSTGRSVDTVSNWITGRAGELPVKTAFELRDEFFPGMTVDYLFDTRPII